LAPLVQNSQSLGFHPAPQIAERVIDLQRRKHHVQHLAFELGAATEIAAHRRCELILVAAQCLPHRFQLASALLQLRVGAGEACITLPDQYVLQILNGVIHIGIPVHPLSRRGFDRPLIPPHLALQPAYRQRVGPSALTPIATGRPNTFPGRLF
jgi:hypothetical protein